MSESQPRYSLRSLLTFNPLKLHSTRVDRSKVNSSNAAVINYMGQDVLFHAHSDGGRHLTEDDLEPYRMVGDTLLDDLLEYMDKEGYPLKPGDDLLASSSSAQNQECEKQQQVTPSPYPLHIQDRIDDFVRSHKTLPSWVDMDQLQRGQSVFLRFVPAMSVSLYYRSLCAGFAIPKIAAVILSTGYLAPPSTPEQVAFRLVDTGALLNACMGHGGVDSLVPGGEGWKICLHVRILHAKVRRTLLRRQGKRAWKTSEYGIPINQEDMAATLLAFSINTLAGVEYLGGVKLSRQNQEDYIALWRYVGWLLGVITGTSDTENADTTATTATRRLPFLDPCGPGWDRSRPDPIEHSKCMLQSMILHLMKPDRSSVTVSHHLLKIGRPIRGDDKNENDKGLSERKDAVVPKKKKEDIEKKEQTSSMDLWFYFRALACRSFIGNPLANALELPLHPVMYKRLFLSCGVVVYLWTFRIMTWVALWEFGGIRLERYFLGLMGRFHSIWTERHPTRMAKALKVQSCCPFAMVTNLDDREEE
jgi:hypothetical protein